MMDENHCITFLWKIENFFYCPDDDDDDNLDSPEFYVNSLSESAWQLRIFPNSDENEDQVTVQLLNNSYHKISNLFIDYEISFLSADGSVVTTGKVQNQKIVAGSSYEISNYPTYDEILENRRKEFLSEDTLTIRCRIWKTLKTLTNSMQFFARTLIGIQTRSFQWSIANFSQLKSNSKRTQRIKMGKDQPTFSFELFLTSATNSQKHVGIDIRQLNTDIPKLFSTWKISVLNASGNAIKCKEDDIWLSPEGEVASFPSFFTKEELISMKAECLIGGILNLLFEIKFSTSDEYSNIESVSCLPPWIHKTVDAKENAARLDIAQSNHHSINSVINVSDQSNDASLAILQMDLLSLYKDKTLSDFELRNGITSFPVHKSVLSARSPVFKAMFSSDMREGAAHSLNIPDVDADTLNRFLKFIYTGTGAILDWEGGCKLYYAADKYDILSLKQKCSTFLTSNITGNNVCEILLLADRHNDEGLKSSIYDYIVLNDSKIIRSTEWNQFLVSNPSLAAETMQLVYSKKLDMQGK